MSGEWVAGVPVSLGSPAAGLGFEYEPAGHGPARVLAVTFQLVTAVAVAARAPVVSFLDGSGNAVAQVAAPFTQAASFTCLYSFTVGGVQYGANNAAHIGGPLPKLTIDSRITLAVTVAAVQAADQISKVRLWMAGGWNEYVEEVQEALGG